MGTDFCYETIRQDIRAVDRGLTYPFYFYTDEDYWNEAFCFDMFGLKDKKMYRKYQQCKEIVRKEVRVILNEINTQLQRRREIFSRNPHLPLSTYISINANLIYCGWLDHPDHLRNLFLCLFLLFFLFVYTSFFLFDLLSGKFYHRFSNREKEWIHEQLNLYPELDSAAIESQLLTRLETVRVKVEALTQISLHCMKHIKFYEDISDSGFSEQLYVISLLRSERDRLQVEICGKPSPMLLVHLGHTLPCEINSTANELNTTVEESKTNTSLSDHLPSSLSMKHTTVQMNNSDEKNKIVIGRREEDSNAITYRELCQIEDLFASIVNNGGENV